MSDYIIPLSGVALAIIAAGAITVAGRRHKEALQPKAERTVVRCRSGEAVSVVGGSGGTAREAYNELSRHVAEFGFSGWRSIGNDILINMREVEIVYYEV